jgi:hypothetical protein
MICNTSNLLQSVLKGTIGRVMEINSACYRPGRHNGVLYANGTMTLCLRQLRLCVAQTRGVNVIIFERFFVNWHGVMYRQITKRTIYRSSRVARAKKTIFILFSPKLCVGDLGAHLIHIWKASGLTDNSL